MNNYNMPICKFYLSNRCVRGLTCKFYHPSNIHNDKRYDSNTFNTSQVNPYTRMKVINLAKMQQDEEPQPYSILKGPFYSIDVECVAIGYGHSQNHRYPSRVALVKSLDGDVVTLLDEWVNLNDVDVVSYMHALTGTSKEDCLNPNAKTLDEIRSLVKQSMPSDSILVGHSIESDITWLGLKKGVDFSEIVCTSILFRQRLPKTINSACSALEKAESNGFEVGSMEQSFGDNLNAPDDRNLPFPTRYRIFSLRHCCINLLQVDIQEAAHDPVMDAKYSLILFEKYKHASSSLLRAVRDSLHRAQTTASFASLNPVVDGVCLSPFGYKMKASARKIWRWWKATKYSSKKH